MPLKDALIGKHLVNKDTNFNKTITTYELDLKTQTVILTLNSKTTINFKKKAIDLMIQNINDNSFEIDGFLLKD